MRAFFLVFALTASAVPASGQTSSASTPKGQGVSLYRLTRKDGSVSYLTEYHKKGYFYVVTNLDGKVTQHNVDLVAKIELLTGEEANAIRSGGAGEKSEPGSEAPLARYSARTQARTQARTAPRRRYYAPQPDPVPYSPWSMGATPTGLPLYMGPRGGVYHYSASGNKVYQRH